MADFCKECSIELFGYDTMDLARIASPDDYITVICEGCGPIMVNDLGIRWSRKMDNEEIQAWVSGLDVDLFPRNFVSDPIKLKK